MKILVTGGAGFIGSNLVRALVRADYDVIALDNFSLGTEKNLHNIKNNLRTVKGNILDSDLLLDLTKNVDIIFNQAAASSSPMFKKNLKEALSVNIDGFVNILNAAKENNVRRVIYASTSSVYGNANPPLREDMKIEPVNFYASSKLMNEHLAALYSIEYGLETVGFRYMSVYGPNEESKGIFANLVTQFLWAMQKNEQPVIYGDGSQSRDFTYVKDVVEANILAMESKKKLY
ncbi:MAG: SDR family NAD(P)-dependent oxidoreductase, partial [Candidatus Aenigmatarchaeota archaeon]